MKRFACIRQAAIAVLIAALAVAGAFWTVAPAGATDVRSGDHVAIRSGTAVPDDLIVFASNFSMAGRIDGDLIAFGSSIDVPGQIAMDAVLAGSNINVSGRVGDDVRAAGSTVRIDGPVATNADLAGSTVTLTDKASVGRDLQAAGGVVNIDGRVARNLRLAAGQATINGTVNGNVVAKVGKLTLGPSAVVRGDLIYTAGQKASVAAGAKVLGQTRFTKQVQQRRETGRGPIVGLAIFSFLALYATGAVILALMPRGSEAVAERARRTPWISLLVGFLAFIAVPAVILVLLITVVGLPVALILLAMYLIAMYVSRVFLALAIGDLVMRRGDGVQRSPYLRLLVGLAILVLVTTILALIPVLGWLANFAIMLTGFGALLYERYTLSRQLRAEGRV